MNRRRLLIGGVGAATAALAGLGYRTWDRGVFSAGKGDAYEAWDQWQGLPGEMPAKRLIHAGILAASAHNTQPWLFEPSDETLTIHADLSRTIGAADPFHRESFTSIGCAVENMGYAHLGYGLDLGETSFLAETERLRDDATTAAITFRVTKYGVNVHAPDILIDLRDAIPRRHTHRGPYIADRHVPKLTEIDPYHWAKDDLVLIADKKAKAELGALIVEATERFIADKEMSADSAKWFRTGRREIEMHRDGISTDTAGLSPMMNAIAKIMPDSDAITADQYWLKSTREVQVPTAAVFGIIFARDRLKIGQAILAGAIWQRMHLLLTAKGLAAQPLNQPIEMMDRDHLLGRKNDYAKDIRKIAGVQAGDPAFIFRLGYAERPALPSPRRRLADVLLRNRYA